MFKKLTYALIAIFKNWSATYINEVLESVKKNGLEALTWELADRENSEVGEKIEDILKSYFWEGMGTFKEAARAEELYNHVLKVLNKEIEKATKEGRTN